MLSVRPISAPTRYTRVDSLYGGYLVQPTGSVVFEDHLGKRSARMVTVIRPSSGWRALQLGEVWRYRELIYFLAWRDIKVRYKQTFFGVAWALLQPLGAMVVFTIVLGRLVGVPSDGVPYALFAYAGLLPWSFFSAAVTGASGSLVANTNLISKVYFPRLVIPLAAILGGLVDLAISSALLVVLLAFWGTTPRPAMLLAPLFILLAMVTALAVGVWLSALDVRYRDVRYAVPFTLQMWLFATPVVYPASLIPEPYRTLAGLNPMAAVVGGFRWATVGGTPPGQMWVVSAVVMVALLVFGLHYFRRMERSFADVI